MDTLTERGMANKLTEVDSEAIMRLSEDLADDLNNALHIIRLSAEILRRNGDREADVESALRQIEATVDRTEVAISLACMKLQLLSEQLRRNGG